MLNFGFVDSNLAEKRKESRGISGIFLVRSCNRRKEQVQQQHLPDHDGAEREGDQNDAVVHVQVNQVSLHRARHHRWRHEGRSAYAQNYIYRENLSLFFA